MRVLFGAAPLVALSLACSAAAVAEELAPVSPHSPAAAAGTPAPVASHGAHWSYGAADGPDRWADLSPSYALCRQGRQQSPIDLGEPGEAGLAGLDLRYRPAALRVVNNGHTIQDEFPPGSHLKTGLREYELLQLHFHAPSEHTLNGRAFPLEVHSCTRTCKAGWACSGSWWRKARQTWRSARSGAGCRNAPTVSTP